MNSAKRKGTQFEVDVVQFLRTHNHDARRNPPAGRNDIGDIGGLRWTLELKATKRIDLAGGMNEAEKEAERNHTRRYALIVKRSRRPIGEAYVVMPLKVFVEIAR